MTDATPPERALYLMIGGFLGAGKTTAVSRLAARLTERGRSVGLITNDQSHGLVDTSVLRSHGFAVEEITGGCFCCRFDSLHEAASRLTAATRPDVFVAEPVGSCTDLVATVSYPLRRMYGDAFAIAPLSVLVDPRRAARIHGLVQGRGFSSKVEYVYRKQLEEADVIVINKSDALESELRDELQAMLRDEYPRARLYTCSAKEGAGLEPWFDDVLTAEASREPTMSIDYDEYAAGEALLGWLNATVAVDADEPFDANHLVADVGERLRRRLVAAEREIAHLKITLDARQDAGQLAVLSLVSSDGEPDLREALFDRVHSGSMIVNLRAEADPAELREALDAVLGPGRPGTPGLVLEHVECFRPGRPRPTHRMKSPDILEETPP